MWISTWARQALLSRILAKKVDGQEGDQHDNRMDFDPSAIFHVLLGVTISDILGRIVWALAASGLTAFGFWGLRKRVAALERRRAEAAPVTNTVNVGTGTPAQPERSWRNPAH